MIYHFFKHVKFFLIFMTITSIFASCQKKSKYQDSYVIVKNGLWGLIDSIGNEIVSPRFIYIEPIQKDGVALAVMDTTYTCECDSSLSDIQNKSVLNIIYGYINSNNKFIFPRPSIVKIALNNYDNSIRYFSEFCRNYSFREGLAIAQDTLTRHYGYIKLNGDTVIPAKYKNAQKFNNGRAAVQLGRSGSQITDNWGLIDSEGQEVCDFVFTTLETPVNERAIATIITFDNFDGRISGKIYKNGRGNISVGKSKEELNTDGSPMISIKVFLVNENGKIINDDMDIMYEYANFTEDGIAVAIPNKMGEFFGRSYGFINKKGEFITPLFLKDITEEAQQLIGSRYFLNWLFPKNIKFKNVTRFSEGYAAVHFDSGWTFVDTRLIPRGNEEYPLFENVLPFENGLAAVKLDGKFGYIKNNFYMAIPCEYDSCAIAGKNLCQVFSGEKTENGYAIVSYIDRRNNIVWQNVNYDGTYFSEKRNIDEKERLEMTQYDYIGKDYTPLWISISIIVLCYISFLVYRMNRTKPKLNSSKHSVKDSSPKSQNIGIQPYILEYPPKTTSEDFEDNHEPNQEYISIRNDYSTNNDPSLTSKPTIDERLNNLFKE